VQSCKAAPGALFLNFSALRENIPGANSDATEIYFFIFTYYVSIGIFNAP